MESTKIVITGPIKKGLISFLKKHKKPDLLTTYLYYLETKYEVNPVVYVKEKKIYRSEKELIRFLESQNKLWRETEIKIQLGHQEVNNETTKIYICPFSGKVFGNNTHPNPLDAIYDWVSKCPENKERIGGLPVKKFYVSEDPEVIKNYIKEIKKPITKMVYSSGITGKLFNSKQAVIDDFKKHHIKPIALVDVPTQNRFQIEEHFMGWFQAQIDDSNITSFVEALSEIEEVSPLIEHWFEEE